jgi:hypothetical protein
MLADENMQPRILCDAEIESVSGAGFIPPLVIVGTAAQQQKQRLQEAWDQAHPWKPGIDLDSVGRLHERVPRL